LASNAATSSAEITFMPVGICCWDKLFAARGGRWGTAEVGVAIFSGFVSLRLHIENATLRINDFVDGPK
jgi:hypothetical protein